MRSTIILYNLLTSQYKQQLGLCLKQRCTPMILSHLYSTNKDDLKEYETPLENIRNFSIIAHVDHGKSTLADRLLELTGAIKVNSGMQILDKLQVEKERGITVKAQTVSLKYKLDGIEYVLNLIDTPGHVDFASEVYRSLAACQGVILVVDANDGVQAQTVANFYLAFGCDLIIIPVINKIDLKNANPEKVAKQLFNLFDIKEKEILKISAKLGLNIEEVLKAIIRRIPPPPSDRDKPLKSLIFDSWFDRYRGCIALVYVKDGVVSIGDQIASCHTGKSYDIKSLSFLRPEEEFVKKIYAGQVGCITCNMRSSGEAYIGDTLHLKSTPVEPLPGFKIAKSMVFAGVYPMDQSQYLSLQSAIEKLTLNDNAVSVTKESSPALGQGWRLGFLGLLHMEVFSQRLEQEHDAQAILTAPGVTYRAKITGKKNIIKYKSDEIYFSNPCQFPDVQIIQELFEPMVIGTIIAPMKYLGAIMSICMERRGVEQSTINIDNERIMIKFKLPLNEIIVDFHDELKSVSSGYASFDYEDCGYEKSNIIKMDVLLNGQQVEELSTLVHYTKATEKARKMCLKLLEIVPRQQFLIAIQVCVGAKVLARENLKPYRKDVAAKLKKQIISEAKGR
ncbi:translation factor GUF1 homolog, mitochondrial isoform X2 [Phymastichus coffea]|uniref:translation factor GUF1 homolog, mitochondrial isoform X2 n=1 Tax=Phymastichus coffea TaxID=108790 RepID=UPI00273AADB2|nr:translation factor GUF1 homolog, mitochondrial isoform X2 [Phymastichus coffea]